MKTTCSMTSQLLVSVLEDGKTYREVGNEHGLVHSTVERRIKGLLRRIVRQGRVPGFDEAWIDSLAQMRKHRTELLSAVEGQQEPSAKRQFDLMNAEQIAAGASRLRERSASANRDVALLYALFSTGLKTIELARLEVRDYIDEDGRVRVRSCLRAEAAVNGQSRPLLFNSARAVEHIDAYLVERLRRKLGMGQAGRYRGLDPTSRLFLTEAGKPYLVTHRSPTDSRPSCKYLQATLRQVFARAGWGGMTAHHARRHVAVCLDRQGADEEQMQELLGLKLTKSVRRLMAGARAPLEVVSRELV